MLNTAQIVPLLLLGLLGQAHCVGMCGPLVLAFPGRTGRLGAHLAWHFGRLTTYTLVGTILGALGSASALTGLGGVQVGVRVLSAALLFGLGFVQLGLIREPGWMGSIKPTRLPGASRLLGGESTAAMLGLGLLFGLLPCGLSYGAFSRTLAASSALEGGAMALAFGLGTVPAMLVLGSALGALLARHRKLAELLAGALMIGMGASELAGLLAA